MTDNTPLPDALPQIKVDPSAIRALLLMLVRVVGIVVTAIGTLTAFVHTRDLAGFINWIKSEDFVGFITALLTVASIGATAWRTLSRKWREVYLTRHVDDKIAVLTKPSPPPSVEDLS